MKAKLNRTLRRNLTVDWANEVEALDLRYHALGIGGVNSMPAPKSVVQATSDLKPTFIRIFLQEFFYTYPNHGIYDWAKLDVYMEAVHAMGGDIMASICLKPNVLYPLVDETIWKPNDIKEWQDLIRALVLRYSKEKPYVTHWAIANEQNIGEMGGCPYLITNPDDYFEYYKFTAEPIREVLPDVKVGGPSNAGGGKENAKYLARFVELCKQNDIPVDFTCYNAYIDNPDEHVEAGRAIRDALDKVNPSVKLYMTEFNVALIGHDELSLEEIAFDSARAASLGASMLALHEDNCVDATFQYHIYDQYCDPAEFAPWYERTRYMAEHWSDLAHRLGLFDLDGKARPQYFLYKMIYSMTGTSVALSGTDAVLRGIASISDDETMRVFLTNYSVQRAPDSVAVFQFENAKAGVYRQNVYRIDSDTATKIKEGAISDYPCVESRLVYVHPDYHFHVYTPADSVTLVEFVKQ